MKDLTEPHWSRTIMFQIVCYEDAERTALYRDGRLVEFSKNDYLDSETILNLSHLGVLVDKVDALYIMSRDAYDDFEERDVEPWPNDLAEIRDWLTKVELHG